MFNLLIANIFLLIIILSSLLFCPIKCIAKEFCLSEKIDPKNFLSLNGNKISAILPEPGHKKLIFYYTSWCPYCRISLQKISLLYPKIKNNVDIIAINGDEDISEAKIAIHQLSIDFPIIWDHRNIVKNIININKVPLLLVLDDTCFIKKYSGTKKISEFLENLKIK